MTVWVILDINPYRVGLEIASSFPYGLSLVFYNHFSIEWNEGEEDDWVMIPLQLEQEC